jgi:hypothetical protein
MSRTRHTVPSAVHGGAWTKNRENNPMQSRVNPGSQHSCCAASGCSHRRLYAAAIVSHWVSPGLELASDVAMSAEPVALHSLKWEAIST